MAAFVAAVALASRRLAGASPRLARAHPCRGGVTPVPRRSRPAVTMATPPAPSPSSSTQVSSPPSVAPAGVTPAVSYTSLDGNSFVLAAGPVADPAVRLFVDPWLVGELKFLPAVPNFYTAFKERIDKDTSVASYGRIDGIVLTQALPDHLHAPTLERLDKATPVLAPGSAAGPLADLGFTDVTIVRPGEAVTFCGVVIEATTGSLVGPPWQDPENGYVFDFGGGSPAVRVYYEPHGNHSDDVLRRVAEIGVGVLVTPVRTVSFKGIGYKLVNGDDALPAVAAVGVSKVVVLENTKTKGVGILNAAIGIKGTIDGFKAGLGEGVQVIVPTVGEPEVLCAGDA